MKAMKVAIETMVAMKEAMAEVMAAMVDVMDTPGFSGAESYY